jgi:hypothetical protein
MLRYAAVGEPDDRDLGEEEEEEDGEGEEGEGRGETQGETMTTSQKDAVFSFGALPMRSK